jgi:hypothetical protein
LVDGAQPARLDGHGDAVGDQLDEVLAALAVAGRSEQPHGAAQRRGDGQRDLEDDRTAYRACPRDLGRACAVAFVDDYGDGMHVEHVAQASNELFDELDGLQPVDETRRDVQEPPRLLRADPPRRLVGQRLGGGRGHGGRAREREPDRVPSIGVVTRAPGRGQAGHEAQPSAVARRPAVPMPRLGQGGLQRARPAVGDGDGDRGVVDFEAHLELGARVQHGVLGEFAGQEDGALGHLRVQVGDPVQHVLEHAARLPGGTRVWRKADPPL